MTCCADVEHVNNFYDTDYEDTIFEGLDALRRITKDFIFTSHTKNCTVANPMQIFADCSGKTTTAEIRNTVREMWGSDAVHPGKECVSKLADYIATLEKEPKSKTAAVSGPLPKRMRWVNEAPLNSVTPLRNFTRGGSRGHGGRGGWQGRPWLRGGGPRGQRRPRY
jgi:hypothetical protein